MTKEDKELLLADFCARIPHDTIVCVNGEEVYLRAVDTFGYKVEVAQTGINVFAIEEVKAYLRPMSSMTEEEHQICNEFKHDIMTQGYGAIELYVTHYTNWLDKKHFDWRRTGNNKTLIEAGLALEAPEGMYNF